jgi:hypothetical protein
MSQKSTEDCFHNFCMKFRGALRAQDFKTVFTLLDRLEAHLKERNASDQVRAIYEVTKKGMPKVMLRWYERLCESSFSDRHAETIKLCDAFLPDYPYEVGRQGLALALHTYELAHKADDILLVVARAYLHKEESDPHTCKIILEQLFDYLRNVPEDLVKETPDYDRDVPDDVLAEAIELRVEVFLVEDLEAGARFLVGDWVKWCRERRRFELAGRLKELLQELKSSEDAVPITVPPPRQKHVVTFGDQERTILIDGVQVISKEKAPA